MYLFSSRARSWGLARKTWEGSRYDPRHRNDAARIDHRRRDLRRLDRADMEGGAVWVGRRIRWRGSSGAYVSRDAATKAVIRQLDAAKKRT